MDSQVLFALLITTAAGLSTGVGSVLGLLAQGFQPRLLSLSLSFSAGVMLFVSFVEILPKARLSLAAALGERPGHAAALLAFFAGIGLIALIDRWLPQHQLLPPESGSTRPARATRTATGAASSDAALLRTGLFTALAIAIHNFPEGLVTFLGAITQPRLGIGIALAIAIHNIPEGLAISAPIYYATGRRWLAFVLSLASGLAEPLGALIGFLLLGRHLSPLLFGVVFASVAGVMVYLCLDELLPAARRHGDHAVTMAGVLGGMAVMGLSLVLLA
ncbi:MAG: zinc transporter ZupT [Synechococcus sp.]|nr:zinc transporter ZupT [Synechococcus sp.]